VLGAGEVSGTRLNRTDDGLVVLGSGESEMMYGVPAGVRPQRDRVAQGLPSAQSEGGAFGQDNVKVVNQFTKGGIVVQGQGASNVVGDWVYP
jgi:hypothetical protein